MAQTDAEQRAEAARLVALHTSGAGWWSDDVADQLLSLLPALLADAEALAARERADEVRRAGRAVIERERETLARLERGGD